MGWAAVRFHEVTRTHSGNSKLIKGKLFAEPREGSFPAFSASGPDVWHDRFEHEGEAIIISAVGARCGKCFRASGKWSAIANTHVVWPDERFVDPKFLWRMINDEDFWVKGGSAQPFVKVGETFEREFPLPSLPEQRRIVAKLDRLSARSRAARDHLTRTAKLATRAKQAILAAAFRGDLTADWRESTCSAAAEADGTASALVSERANLLAATPARRKGKAVQDDHHRVALELELPDEWRMTTMEAATSPVRLIQYGILKPGPDVPGGIPYVKVLNIKGGRIVPDKIRHTTSAIHIEYLRSSLTAGDLLLTIRGTVGRLAFVPDDLDGGNITQDTVRIDVLNAMNARFVFWYLQCPAAEKYFNDNQKGVAVRGINVGDVRPMEVPLPGKREQDEIVRRIEAAFARIDRLTAEAARAGHLLDRLDERLLTKAFRGELVPQDPADEPAEALLARIRAARAEMPAPRRRKRPKAED